MKYVKNMKIGSRLGLGFGLILVLTIIIAAVSLWRLQAVADTTRQVADGDLTANITVTADDETGQLLQSLKDINGNLLRIVDDVRIGTDMMTTATAEIASGNMNLSARTEDQANALGTTAATMEELTSTVKQHADNARQANQLARTASEVAVRGGVVVSKMDDATQQNAALVEQAAAASQSLQEQASQLSQVVAVFRV